MASQNAADSVSVVNSNFSFKLAVSKQKRQRRQESRGRSKLHMGTDLITLLGTELKGPAVRKYLEVVGDSPEVFDDSIDLYYSFPRKGVSLIFRKGRVDSIMLYAEGRDSFSRYTGVLPFGLSFSDGISVAQGKVDRDIAASGQVRAPFLGRKESNWIKFRFQEWTLHLEFKSATLSEISLVTISARRGDSSN